jgi:hypothetical protein
MRLRLPDLDRFLAEDDGKPIVMLNLLRFRKDGLAIT